MLTFLYMADMTSKSPGPLGMSETMDCLISSMIRRRLVCPRSTWCCSRFTTAVNRSEEHTSELQSLMRISYAVFCLKKKKIYNIISHKSNNHILNYNL